MRRRDVVAARGENQQRRADPGQVDETTVANAQLPPFQFVNDEQVLDNAKDFLAA
jgi:hypothetical protein